MGGGVVGGGVVTAAVENSITIKFNFHYTLNFRQLYQSF